MSNLLSTLAADFGLLPKEAVDLGLLTNNTLAALQTSSEHLIQAGTYINSARDYLKDKSQFESWAEVYLKISGRMAYKLARVAEVYGDSDIEGLGQTVLVELTHAPDPKEALKEALALQQEKGKVEVKDAKEIAKRAKEVIEAGEVEEYTPDHSVSPRASQEALEAVHEPVPHSGSLSRAKKIARAKRLLNTLLDLLAVETTNAEITEDDLLGAVAEMLMSGDESEAAGMRQLREFCALVSKPIL